MASIGPQLPPQLSKRKRSCSSTDDAPSAKPTPSTAQNKDEISLSDEEDGDDDSIRPQMPAQNNKSHSKPDPRPAPLIYSAWKNKNEIALASSSDSDDDTGPLPTASPATTTSRVMGPTMPPKPVARVLGPSLPPTLLDKSSKTGVDSPSSRQGISQLPPDPASESESDSDDGYGPALPTGTYNDESRSNMPLADQDHEAPSGPKRDDWMLAPPASSTARAPDPTRIKSRTFASGRGAAAPKSSELSSIWTETPEEKRRRLENAVLGRADESEPKKNHVAPSDAQERIEREKRRKISEYTEQTRGKSLYSVRQEALKSGAGGSVVEEEDDPSKRAFDIKKDMAIGGRLDKGQKKEMLNKAANFGDRFQKGSFL
ncbi:hypothetical protein BROUX41_001237 [Berkeleyomyces rouxiae]|uniref:uncharacterized protein n=1 Tax=Berkeleyomyces rouxiae TaxID=2035830 RepID=UPI003B7DEE4F